MKVCQISASTSLVSHIKLSGPSKSSCGYLEKDNAFLTGVEATSSKSYLDAAKSLLSGGGSLTEAALLLEAAIQRGDTGQGGFEAWLLLGECRSMDEREDQAMQALAEGNRIAEEGGTPGAGLLVCTDLLLSILSLNIYVDSCHQLHE
jgi:hypothetical protein